MTIIERTEKIHNDLVESNSESIPSWRLAYRLERTQRRNALSENSILPLYIVTLGISRNYGGPEEGGWWYDWTDVEDVKRVWGWQAARNAIRKLKEDYPNSRYGRGSVLGGVDFEIRLSSDPEEIEDWQSTERPYYC